MEGYGLYWFCLELIAQTVEKHNLTFELEHDSELIAEDTNIHQERVQEMMTDFVKWKLFENTDGAITCLKMATRTDEYTQKLIKQSGIVPTLSRQEHDNVRLNRREEKRLEENRQEEIGKSTTVDPRCPHEEIIKLYHKILPELPKVVAKWSGTRKTHLAARWKEYPDIKLWEQFFYLVRDSNFLMGKTNGRNGGKPFNASLTWLVKPENFVKTLEKNYE